MNKIKLTHLKWKNKRENNNTTLLDKKKWNGKEINNVNRTLLEVFYSIKPTNTYPGWLHNNLKVYRTIQRNPENKMLKRMFMDCHLRLFSMKSTWKFAKRIYNEERERGNV